MGLFSKAHVIEYIDGLKECIFDEGMLAVINIIIIFKKLKEKLGEGCRIYSMYDNIRS